MTPPETAAARTVAVELDETSSVEDAVRRLLAHVGEDPHREGLRETPARVARSLLELTSGYADDPAAILERTFAESYSEPVVVAGIAFSSLCEHHLLPFHGTATIAYVPDGRVVGLSKLARLVHCFARRLQVQERLTEQVAEAIDAHLRPRGVAVHISAEHACMSLRGVRTGATTRTSAFRGEYADEPIRTAFLAEARGAP